MPMKKKTTSKTKSPAQKKPAAKKKEAAAGSAEWLRALAPDYAEAPDMPVGVAVVEFGSLGRLAKSVSKELGKVGIGGKEIEALGVLTGRLRECEATWQRARAAVKLGGGERAKLLEAEALEAKLLAGGRWALRKSAEAQAELSRIAEGSGLADTIQDLRDLLVFWGTHASEMKNTDITKKDLTRAAALAESLGQAAEKESSSLDAASALDLRNRCFWATDELAREVREAGRYAFRLEPKVAAKFVSRYRNMLNRRSRAKAKAPQSSTPSTGG